MLMAYAICFTRFLCSNKNNNRTLSHYLGKLHELNSSPKKLNFNKSICGKVFSGDMILPRWRKGQNPFIAINPVKTSMNICLFIKSKSNQAA